MSGAAVSPAAPAAASGIGTSGRPASLSGWGRYPRANCHSFAATSREQVLRTIAGQPRLIARGNGRAYGDAALNPGATLLMRGCDRVLDFDPATGQLRCEAGVLLADILAAFVPRGWFPPVTPGTKFVTVGGMIATDVHGKNHHKVGCFGDHVESLELALDDERVVRCSAQENAALFAATRGGMGLTGVILEASFRLLPIETRMIRRETVCARNLDEVMAQFEASLDWTYSVAWIDCLAGGAALGRSVLQLGEHATPSELPTAGRHAGLASPARTARRVPVDFPSFALNRWSVGAFNALYYRRARPGRDYVDLDPFFYPLDALLDWNRIYGRAGFFQYQCVLPLEAGRAGLALLLHRIREGGGGSFLTVLKRFGPGSASRGLLSFPLEGYTLALDFPVSARTLRIAAELDAVVADHGGRLYLAKDACMPPAMLRFYPELDRFRALIGDAGARRFQSLQSQRLGL